MRPADLRHAALLVLPLGLLIGSAVPAGAADVAYGGVDAATVRVFAIGTVDVDDVTVAGRTLKVAAPRAGHGTGFSVGAGLIVTAHHVVEGARHVVVRLPGEGGFYVARLAYDDKAADVAVLVVDATVPVLEIAADAQLRVRQTVYAVGYPLDPRRTQAQSARGIVSGQTDAGALQLDMALNPGNSGGPLVDEQERVVGMVVARGDPEHGVQGIAFGVGAEQLLAAVKEAQRRLDAGEVAAVDDRHKLGATIVDELVQQGVFHEIHEAADFEGGLRSSNVQAALDALAGRIEDADLLVFVAAHMWNAHLVLTWVGDETLRSAKLSRAEARDLAARFRDAAAAACRKARQADSAIAARSPIVDVVLATRRVPVRPVIIRQAAAREHRPVPLDLLLRVSSAVVQREGLNVGWGLGLGLDGRRHAASLGPVRLAPYAGVGIGRVYFAEEVHHTYFLFEVGATLKFHSRCQVTAAWTPNVYWPSGLPSRGSAISFRLAAAVRVAAGMYVGAAVQDFATTALWVEPLVLAFSF